jgi:two-component system, LytTR family, response regulator
MEIKCIAIDDEPLALDVIQEYCRKLSFLSLVQTLDNAVDVINYLKQNPVDLMFLDIQMEGLTGIQLLGILQVRPKVIMTTAYESYALKGYELDVSDYLLKPISFERFTRAVNKVYEQILLEKQNQPNIQQGANPAESIDKEGGYFFVKADAKLVKIRFEDILYIEGQGDYLMIVTGHNKVMTLQNFSNILKALPGNNFVRVHKSFVVSFEMIDKIDKNRIIIREKTIPISDTYKKAFFDQVKTREV